MKTATVDEKHRIQIPELKPGQVVAYDQGKDGTITLTEVKQADYVPPKFKLVKEDGYTVIDTDRHVSAETIKELLADFP